MNKPDLKGISDILKIFKDSYKDKHAYKLGLVQNAWIEILGNQAFQKVQKFSLKGEILYVKCSSNSLRHELSMQKTRLINAMQIKLGEEININEIILN
tara:strand:- start:84 stop:377 length:294 start_codon:yes stop_codon:yes gene_type:complete